MKEKDVQEYSSREKLCNQSKGLRVCGFLLSTQKVIATGITENAGTYCIEVHLELNAKIKRNPDDLNAKIFGDTEIQISHRTLSSIRERF